ncbi:MAG TPA: formate dehydrogenase accessory sulfurtransferase FdhD [Burkholderiaceae bacterium]|nr:formate dehydrogenase accessory sulfurtransferase FdhD [Burkholderiaceae bacterium]
MKPASNALPRPSATPDPRNARSGKRGHAPNDDDARQPAAASGASQQRVMRTGHHGLSHFEIDQIAQEIPVALEYNGISHATLLATPCDLEDLAYGFSFTEGIIRTAHDIYDVAVTEAAAGLVIQLTIAHARLNQLKLRRRALAGRTGCGLCGIESLDEVRRDLPALEPRPARISRRAIVHAIDRLRDLQPLHQATGATHAAGWADAQGDVQHVREDVGRHNALDKLIGHLLRHGIAPGDGIAAISSRASFEMVQKSAAAGIGVIAAVSAPTSFAIQIADELNVLLAGFARDGRFNLYAHPEFLSHPGEPR